MDQAFVGRQPIFDRDLNVYAYELLFRAGTANAAGEVDDTLATSQVVLNTFTELGLEHIVGEHKAFINLGRDFLLDDSPLPFPKERVVLEILERVEVDEAVIAAVRGFARDGYTVALDDFIYHDTLQPLVDIAHIIKIDVRSLDPAAINTHVQRLHVNGTRLLAEKVETQEEFDSLKAMGFDYFQGYFLERPKVISGRRTPAGRLSVMRLLAHLQQPDVDIADVERLIGQDVSLSYKLLRYINSAFFSLPKRVESIRNAVVYLGLGAIKRWVSLLAMSGMDDRPSELLVTALLRARMAELLATAAGYPDREKFFTAGLFSTLDALMEMKMNEILEALPLADDLEAALLRHEGPLGEALACVVAHEHWSWEAVSFGGLSQAAINEAYVEATGWSIDSARLVLG